MNTIESTKHPLPWENVSREPYPMETRERVAVPLEIDQTVDEEKVSWWQKAYEALRSWFSSPQAIEEIASVTASNTAIPLKPSLESPMYQFSLTPALEQCKERGRAPVTQESLQILEGLSDKTIEEIMLTIITAQTEVQEKGIREFDNIVQRLEEGKKLQDRVLREVKEALRRDESVGFWCRQGMSISLIARVILPYMSGLAFLSGGLTALGTVCGAVQLYYEHRQCEHQARLDDYTHLSSHYVRHTEEMQGHLLDKGKALFKEHDAALRVIHRLKRQMDMVLKKSR